MQFNTNPDGGLDPKATKPEFKRMAAPIREFTALAQVPTVLQPTAEALLPLLKTILEYFNQPEPEDPE